MEEIWQKFENRLRAFTMSKVNDKSVTDDIMQELFIRIHANIDMVRDDTKIQSWIYQICRNLITDHFRTRTRQIEGTMQESTDPEDEYADREGTSSVIHEPEDKNHDIDMQGRFPVHHDREDNDFPLAPEGAVGQVTKW